jgi:hypothetical protein
MPTISRSTNTQVITKDGEVTLNINLSIDLNLKDLGGLESVLSNLPKEKNQINFSGSPKKEIDKVEMVIPDFQSTNKEKVKFGKPAS